MNSGHQVLLIGGKSDGFRHVAESLSELKIMYRPPVTFAVDAHTYDKQSVEETYQVHSLAPNVYIGAISGMSFDDAVCRLIRRYPKMRKKKYQSWGKRSKKKKIAPQFQNIYLSQPFPFPTIPIVPIGSVTTTPLPKSALYPTTTP